MDQLWGAAATLPVTMAHWEIMLVRAGDKLGLL